jgi:hypothetical protein
VASKFCVIETPGYPFVSRTPGSFRMVDPSVQSLRPSSIPESESTGASDSQLSLRLRKRMRSESECEDGMSNASATRKQPPPLNLTLHFHIPIDDCNPDWDHRLIGVNESLPRSGAKCRFVGMNKMRADLPHRPKSAVFQNGAYATPVVARLLGCHHLSSPRHTSQTTTSVSKERDFHRPVRNIKLTIVQ